MKKNFVFKAFNLALAMILSLSSTVFAQDANVTKLVEQLQQQMSSMQQTIQSQNAKIASLESSNWEGPIKDVKASAHKKDEKEEFKKLLEGELGKDYKTFKNLKFSGDLRLRYEAFDFTSGHPSESDSINRFRFRLRMGLEKKFNDEFTAGFRLASGSTTDPTSTNTTLSGNFVFKTIVIDRAYATYTPSWAKDKGAVEKLTIHGGKFKNPFEKGSSDIIWDRDVNPEGLAQTIDFQLLDTEDIKMKGWANFGQFILTQGGAAENANAELFAYQVGLNPKFKVPGLEKPLGWTTALSLYQYSDYAEATNFGAFARGNPVQAGDATSLAAQEFNVLNIYNELNIPVMGMPVKPYFDYARNMSEKASLAQHGGRDTAWALGLNIGSAKKKGEWQIGYAYKWIEANSVVAAFNDSDFGNGHSDKRGSVFKAKYMLTDFLDLSAAAIFANNISAGTILRDEEQRRFQVDLAWKW